MDHFYKELTVEQQLRFAGKLAPRAPPYMLHEEFDGEMPSDDEAIESDIQYCLRVILRSFSPSIDSQLGKTKRQNFNKLVRRRKEAIQHGFRVDVPSFCFLFRRGKNFRLSSNIYFSQLQV